MRSLSDARVAFAVNLAIAAVVAGLVRALDGPWWAAAGFASVAYLLVSVSDRIVLGLRELAQLIRSGGR